jgi:chromate transport protein ChrA
MGVGNVESGTIWKDVDEPPAAAAEDRASGWSGVLPAICAVHCLAMPILASTLPFFAATHAWEAWLVGLSALLAVVTLAVSWRLHGRRVVWAVAALGFAVWIAALAGWLGPLPESLMSPLGGVLVAISLFWNGHLRHQAVCGSCVCPVHPAGA